MDCLPGKQLSVSVPALALRACHPKLLFGGGGDADSDEDSYEGDAAGGADGLGSSAAAAGAAAAMDEDGAAGSSAGGAVAGSGGSTRSPRSSPIGGGGGVWATRGQRLGRRRSAFPPGPHWSQALWGGAGDGRSGGGGGSLLYPCGGFTGAGLGGPGFGSLDQLDPLAAEAMVRLASAPAAVRASLGAGAPTYAKNKARDGKLHANALLAAIEVQTRASPKMGEGEGGGAR